jgi:ABC-2 type transport system ATP-binding protein
MNGGNMNYADRPLVAEKLIKHYKNKCAVDEISISIDRGECLALLGPNGAGKTTVCEILEGLIEADSGVVKIFGMDIKKDRQKILEKVGVQLQETNLYGRFTVEETLNLFASFYKDTIPVEQIISKMQLDSKKNDILKNLSGGQKQRVYLGSSIINKPELLFLDEPTTGLDPQARRQIWDIIAEIKEDGRSILLTTHYMEEAEILADRIAIQDNGKIIAMGTPDSLINEHIGGEIISVTFSSEISPDEQSKLTKKIDFASSPVKITNSNIEIPTKNATKNSVTILELCSSLDIPVSGLSMRKGSLEDVFLKLTGRSIRDA